VLTVGFHFLISLLLAVVFASMVSGPPGLALLTVLPGLVVLLLFGWSAAVLSALAHVYFPDTQHLAELGLQALFFLTPVMYPATLLQQHGLGRLTQLNPLAHLLELIRQPVLAGQAAPWSCYAVSAGFALFLACAAGWALSRLERRLIFAL
jgi:ABC-type polysaccharide/polyol phosphate export permease